MDAQAVAEAEPIERDQLLAIIDRQARKHLGMSGEAFMAAWREQTLADPDRPEVARVASLIPGGW